MKRRAFVGVSGITAVGAALRAGAAGALQTAEAKLNPPAQPPVNPFEQEGQWFKAALHVHTTTSDGDVDVATRLGQYRKAGFQVVAVTDHWKTNDLSGRSDESFLAINSMEAHPQTATGAPAHHFVCLDLPHPFELSKTLPAQELIDTVRKAGGRLVYAHPYWTAHSMDEISEVGGFMGVEVYNAHCDLASRKGFSQVHVDQMLNKGIVPALTAVDDVHKSAWIGRGWTMVKAKSLAKTEVMEAIGRGSFYASCGPTIEDCRIESGTIHVRCSPAAEIRFLFNGAGGGRLYEGAAGAAITEAAWKFDTGRKSVRWIRVEVVDKDGRHAWTNPFVVGGRA